jgi:hypothetical protein
LKDDFEKFSSEHKKLLELLDLFNRQSEELLRRFNTIRQSCLVKVIEVTLQILLSQERKSSFYFRHFFSFLIIHQAMRLAAKIQQSITSLRKNELQVIVSATKKEKEDIFYLRFVHELKSTFSEIVSPPSSRDISL